MSLGTGFSGLGGHFSPSFASLDVATSLLLDVNTTILVEVRENGAYRVVLDAS